MENKLQVRDLRISFRTTNGKVQAVRGIDFDLAKGETLAIVGESGSGKSVTSKAILGIQAANSITESGEILYDGKDLLKISEEDFHKIRGDKIAMIFQDPMSSLNPIVKIGRQLTEAMILKGKARQRESKKTFAEHLELLEKAMIAADPARAEELSAKCKKFAEFEKRHVALEAVYNRAYEAASEVTDELKDLIFELDKKAAKDAAFRVKECRRLCNVAIHEYVVNARAEELKSAADAAVAAYNANKKTEDFDDAVASLKVCKEIIDEALAFAQPNFFRMAYYLCYSGEALPAMPVDKLNEFLLDYLDREFMIDFLKDVREGLKYSADTSYEAMKTAIDSLKSHRAVFEQAELDKAASKQALKEMNDAVLASIDRLAIVKDSLSYTFEAGVSSEIDRYFKSIGKNAKAIKAYDKSKAKYDRLVARGKEPDWKVAAAAVTDLDMVRANILHIIDRLSEHLAQRLAQRQMRDFATEANDNIDFLKTNAAGIVAKVTKAVAKHRAIKLMDEVGIAEPRKRFKQYPFEFSGGMRQRIVIAIALAANPDILICDEPTTALDVTIQAQILELINRLKEQRQLSVIFITHDLGVVANMADRVAVMYAGKIVEYGTSEDIFYNSRHPYTWALLASMPDLDTNERLEAIPGTPPNMIYPPVGDAFAARNKYAMQIDFEEQPPMFKISDTHYAATWLLHPDAPKVDPPKIIVDRIARMEVKRGADHAE